jgi:hypothetical protein
VINPGSGAIITGCEFSGSPGFTAIEINSDAHSIVSANFLHHCEVGIRCGKDAANYIISGNQVSGNNQPIVGAEGQKSIVKDNL